MTPVAIAVVEHLGRYLVGTRREDQTLAGRSEFPGGKIEMGESPDAAAARECREETGLRIAVLGLRREAFHRYPHGDVRLFFFDCVPLDPDAAPHPPFRWLESGELGQLHFPEASLPVVAELLAASAKQETGQQAMPQGTAGSSRGISTRRGQRR